MIGHFIEGAIVLKPLKGQTGYVMKLNWVCSVSLSLSWVEFECIVDV